MIFSILQLVNEKVGTGTVQQVIATTDGKTIHTFQSSTHFIQFMPNSTNCHLEENHTHVLFIFSYLEGDVLYNVARSSLTEEQIKKLYFNVGFTMGTVDRILSYNLAN